MRSLSTTAAIGFAATVFFSFAPAMAAPDALAGRKFAQTECGECHIVVNKGGKHLQARAQGAPPHFQTIAENAAMTDDKIREILRLPHGSMANLLISERDTLNVIAYINSLRK